MRGPLVFVRNYSGTLSDRAVLFNTTQGKKERVNQILSVSADDLDQVQELRPGQVGCLVGLKHTRTGDTLVIDRGPLQQYVLEGLALPKQVFSLAIEPELSSQQGEMEEALHVLCAEDPSLTYHIDEESGQNLIGGLGELHLEIICDKLKQRFDINVSIGNAYVAYRETLHEDIGKLTKSLLYDRTIGTKRLFADITLEIKPTGTTDTPSIIISSDLKASLTLDQRVALVEGIEASLTRGPRGLSCGRLASHGNKRKYGCRHYPWCHTCLLCTHTRCSATGIRTGALGAGDGIGDRSSIQQRWRHFVRFDSEEKSAS